MRRNRFVRHCIATFRGSHAPARLLASAALEQRIAATGSEHAPRIGHRDLIAADALLETRMMMVS
jgi:hypothetical protein